MSRTECDKHIIIKINEEEKEIIENFRKISEKQKYIIKETLEEYMETNYKKKRNNFKMLLKDNT